MNGCPNCLEIDTIVYACDALNCWEAVTCGTPTKKGYRSTCDFHAPRGLSKEAMVTPERGGHDNIKETSSEM